MKKKKNNLDERQELTLLHVEKRGCWIAFFGLLISIFVQQFLGHGSFQQIAGEAIVFLLLGLYISISCIKNGIWDRSLRPTLKTNLLTSIIAGLVAGFYHFSFSYYNYHKLYGSIATGLVIFFTTFLLCFAFLSLAATIYRKRVEKIENSLDEK